MSDGCLAGFWNASPEYGEHLRLFQRDLEKRPYLPKPSDVTSVTASNFGPTQQKK